jgi:probable rRNA maturation factor
LECVPTYIVDVTVFPPFARRISKKWLRSVAELTLARCHTNRASGISLVIADDETVQALNLEYRDLDETTDVLAFPLTESSHVDHIGIADFPLPPQHTPTIGEVVISYPQAAKQAKEGRKSTKAEMALLTIHGILHLFGYDHATPEEEAQMWSKQDSILAKVTAN